MDLPDPRFDDVVEQAVLQAAEAVYIAVIPYPGEPRPTHHLEIEVDQGTIAAVWDTDTADLDEARSQADELEVALNARGLEVVQTREAWDEYLTARGYEDEEDDEADDGGLDG